MHHYEWNICALGSFSRHTKTSTTCACQIRVKLGNYSFQRTNNEQETIQTSPCFVLISLASKKNLGKNVSLDVIEAVFVLSVFVKKKKMCELNF